jgi:hypothetical protein
MSLEQTLRALNDHPNDDVANFAADAHELQTDLSTGKISKAEYNELLEDIKHKQAILVAAADLETKAMLNEVLNGMIKLASAL